MAGKLNEFGAKTRHLQNRAATAVTEAKSPIARAWNGEESDAPAD